MNKFKSYLPLLAYSLLGTAAYYFYIQLKRKRETQVKQKQAKMQK